MSANGGPRKMGKRQGHTRRLALAVLPVLITLGAPQDAAANESARPKRIYARYYGVFAPGRPATAAFGYDQVVHRVQPVTIPQREHFYEGSPLRMGALPLMPNVYLRSYWRLDPDTAIDLDVRRAIRAGIDGFAVQIGLGGSEARRALHVLFRVVERNAYPFEITISIDPHNVKDEWNYGHHAGWSPGRESQPALDLMMREVRRLLRVFGDHPNLARRDGKPLIFVKNGSLLLQTLFYLAPEDDVPDATDEPDPETLRSAEALEAWNQAQVSRRLEREWRVFEAFVAELEAVAGSELYVVLDAGGAPRMRVLGQAPRWQLTGLPKGWRERKAGALAQFAPAVTLFQPGQPVALDRAAEHVRAADAEWCYPLVWQFEYLDYRRERLRSQFGIGAEGLRQAWADAIRQDASLILLHSWNDYRTLSHIAPDQNHHYAPMLLNAYYAQWWRTGQAPVPDTDTVMAFFRRYPPGADIFPRTRGFEEPDAGALEIVALLSAPGRIRVPERGPDGGALEWDAPAGLSFRQLPLDPGPVRVELERDNAVIQTLACMEWITDKPFRQDNATVGETTAFEREWALDFGVDPFTRRNDLERPFYSEYGDLDGDGLPNWFEALYGGGRWMHPEDMTALDPEAQGFGRITNLEAYRQRRDPRRDQIPSQPGVVDESVDLDALLFGDGPIR